MRYWGNTPNAVTDRFPNHIFPNTWNMSKGATVLNKYPMGLTAAHLRVLALILMLLDHLGRTRFPGHDWMIILGRLAFPIFAFQITEGYRHTHDFHGYCKRLLVFALVSEIPFNLMISGSPVFPLHQNVIFTLLLGLLACRALDREKGWAAPVILLAAALTFPDYGVPGVLTVLTFHEFQDHPWLQLAALIAINTFGFHGQILPFGAFELPVQSFAAFAWIPILLYNGEKGRGGRWLQYGSYVFYPLHMLLLGLMA